MITLAALRDHAVRESLAHYCVGKYAMVYPCDGDNDDNYIQATWHTSAEVRDFALTLSHPFWFAAKDGYITHSCTVSHGQIDDIIATLNRRHKVIQYELIQRNQRLFDKLTKEGLTE